MPYTERGREIRNMIHAMIVLTTYFGGLNLKSGKTIALNSSEKDRNIQDSLTLVYVGSLMQTEKGFPLSYIPILAYQTKTQTNTCYNIQL